MKLYITRDQAKGGIRRSKIIFELRAKTELTDEELALVRKYKADKEMLLRKEVKIPLLGKSISFELTIGSLMRGATFRGEDIATILAYEENVKESCEAFKTYLEVMKSFGGEEVVEYV